MIIDINNFDDGEVRKISFNENFSIPEDYSVNGDAYADVSGEISNNKGKFHFIGKVYAKLNVNCDVCLKPFDIELNFDVDEIFVRSDEITDENDDYWLFSEKSIDFNPMILSCILLNIPMRTVCSDNCKGLCSICGHNLNEGECGCERTYINPNFEKLKALFEENEEEV